jgi:site-specific recombinase
MLSVWVAAEELEPELLRLDPRIAERDSAFVAQQRETGDFRPRLPRLAEDPGTRLHRRPACAVLLDQCSEQIARLRRRAVTRAAASR